MVYLFEREQQVPRPRSEVFAFFADAQNLESLTPAALRFHIETPLPIVMAAGTIIDYRLKLFGVPCRWRTLIERFEPEKSFVDLQVRGPYRMWRHCHEFLEVEGGTLMRDRVEYQLPLGRPGGVVQSVLVGGQLRPIFDFRRAVIERMFPFSDGRPRDRADGSEAIVG